MKAIHLVYHYSTLHTYVQYIIVVFSGRGGGLNGEGTYLHVCMYLYEMLLLDTRT